MSGRRLSVIVLCADRSLQCGDACFTWCLLLILEPRLLCCLQWCVHMVQRAGHCRSSVLMPGSTMAQAVIGWPVTVEAQVQIQASPVWGLWWTKWHWDGFFLPVHQFSPVSIIPPLLHTHSSIYHPRCIMFFSQYFSFPLSVSFHHPSTHIRLQGTLYNLSHYKRHQMTQKWPNCQTISKYFDRNLWLPRGLIWIFTRGEDCCRKKQTNTQKFTYAGAIPPILP